MNLYRNLGVFIIAFLLLSGNVVRSKDSVVIGKPAPDNISVQAKQNWPEQYQEHFIIQFFLGHANVGKIKSFVQTSSLALGKIKAKPVHLSSITLTLHFSIPTYLQHQVIRI